MNDTDVLFCRKAVINPLAETVAYHLLHLEDLNENSGAFLSSIFIDINLNEVTNQKAAFFQVSVEQLKSLPLEQELQIVAFLSSETLSEQDLDLLFETRLKGCQLGIINPDLHLFSEDFFAVFSYVAFDLSALSVEEVLTHSAHPFLREKNIWINEIEQQGDFVQLQESLPNGCFSGDFIKKKTEVKGKKVLAYQSILLELLSVLNRQETSLSSLAECIERDPALTYRIIKLTHTSLYHGQFNVSSAQRAVEIIGIRDLTKWVSLVMLGSVPGKPASLFSMASSRAFFCQSLSTALLPRLDGAFLVGLFSYLPSFFNEELPILLKELPLDKNIKVALLERKGNLGGILKTVEAYESGCWEKIPFSQFAEKGISKHSLKDMYIESLKMAREMSEL